MIRKLILTVAAVLTLGGGAAVGSALAAGSYCDPLAGCTSLKLSPATVVRGHSIRVYGSVAGGCQLPGTVTLYSNAFHGATHRSFAGVPALYVRASQSGGFSVRVTISRRVKTGRYHVGGRCGGGNFGSATLHVIR